MTDHREIKQIWAEIQENSKHLDSCEGHRFGDCCFIDSSRPMTSQKLVCEHCSGSMKVQDVFRYREGYVAAGGNGDDVLSGTDRPLR